ncbi:CYTH domain-containing protein [soil metagenome]
MGIEIERKFRVLSLGDYPLGDGEEIDQGYLSDGDPTVRVRTKGRKAFITIKNRGKDPEDGEPISSAEFEYEIPMNDAAELLDIARFRLQKTRYRTDSGVEIDVFKSPHDALIMAEYESEDGAQPAPLPGVNWFEVTEDRRYSNASIARNGVPPLDEK